MVAAESEQSPGLLVTRDLTCRFGGVTAVSHVNLIIPSGQISGVIGPNGAGKTTLFNMIAGALKPTEGDIYFRSIKITGRSETDIVRLGIARTFQNARLFPNVTALENVIAGCCAHMHTDPISIILGAPWARREEQTAHELAHELLAFVGIPHLADRLAKELSYGDQRRVAIARALATRPTLLLLDEPAAGMNEAETEQLVVLLERIAACGITILLIEHDMSVVMRVCRIITVLDHGECIAQGPPATIQQNERVVEAYLGRDDARTSRRHLRLRRDSRR